jgi:hypothetical protein
MVVIDGPGGREAAISDAGRLIARVKDHLALQFAGRVCEDGCRPFLLWASEPSAAITPPDAHPARR